MGQATICIGTGRNAHEEATRYSMQNFTFMAVVGQCNFGSVQSPLYLKQ